MRTIKRNFVTSGMDEVETAVYKASSNDDVPVKDKHVQLLLRSAADPAQAAHVGEALVKRLQSFDKAKETVFAKILVVMHRIALAGYGGVLSREGVVAAAVAAGKELQGSVRFVIGCATYVKELCAWPNASVLGEARVARELRRKPAEQVCTELPQLQQLLAAALTCAEVGASANLAMCTLRLGVVEDTLALVGCVAAAAAALQGGLLGLPLRPARAASHAARTRAAPTLARVRTAMAHPSARACRPARAPPTLSSCWRCATRRRAAPSRRAAAAACC